MEIATAKAHVVRPDDTIYALSSAAGRAAIAVVRLTGPAAGEVVTALTGRALPAPRQAVLRRLCDPTSGELLDEGLVLWFPGPGSVTGEDLAELHLHGSQAVQGGVFAALGALPGVRPAEPGEFTRRAFFNGKLDLPRVEGLADLIEAETAAQRRQATAQLGGALSRQLAAWRDRLIEAAAWLEGAIEFEEEVPAATLARAETAAREVGKAIAEALASAPRGERVRRGLTVVLLGAPNAGKSSLLNALAGRDVAIVSPRPGTTRDLIEVHLDLAGWPVTVVDTAGLAVASEDEIELEGIRRAQQRAEAADLRLLLIDRSVSNNADLSVNADLMIGSKADLSPLVDQPVDLSVSVKTGQGLDALIARLAEEAQRRLQGEGGEAPLVTRERQRLALSEAATALGRVTNAGLPELKAEELRLALRALGRVAGTVDVEDLLDVIFRDFCIGK